MKSKLLGMLVFLLLTTNAHATLIIGNIYQDSSNTNWVYIGDYNVGDGPAWQTAPLNYSALQAAEIVFGALEVGQTYAISTSDTLVDHMAWYDGYGDGSYLPTYNSYGSGQSLPENFFVDVGSIGYTTGGDYSAYVGSDRAALGGGAFNHVFVSSVAPVPEPSTMLLLGAGLVGLVGARRKLKK